MTGEEARLLTDLQDTVEELRIQTKTLAQTILAFRAGDTSDTGLLLLADIAGYTEVAKKLRKKLYA